MINYRTCKLSTGIILIMLFGLFENLYSQSITMTIRGKVFDHITQQSLPFATVTIENSDPLIGTTADLDGNFIIENVPVGRISIRVDMMGYKPHIISELLVSSGNEVVLSVGLQQTYTALEAVEIGVSKDSPLNTMSSVSGRQFTVEETQRYAGGLDDPARLVTSFAGVASPSVGSSGISVRGNNPDGLLWRIEGVEVPNPNHFADLTIAGGGMLTAISTQIMGNSDFFAGAFPAEYGNALSGVFDINLQSGNTARRQYTFQAGLLGTDFAAEGPFLKGKKATYNINYRYSTMALIGSVLPSDAGVLKYQDLSFKTNFPTKKLGTFSVWGIGALDGVDMEATDSTAWEYDVDKDNSQTSLNMFATGLTHKLMLGSSAFLNSAISATGNGISHDEQRLRQNFEPYLRSRADNQSYRLAFLSNLTKRFGKIHTNKTGFNYQHLRYQLNIQESPSPGTEAVQIVDQNGSSGLLQVYSQSEIALSNKLTANVGLNSQYFLLNENLSLEPRAGIRYHVNDKHSVALGYGSHSRIEQLPIYFLESEGLQPNKDLEFMKSSHYVLSYSAKLSDKLRFTAETYYQELSNVPVSPTTYISTLNNDNALFFNEMLISEGSGRNLGVDLTLDRQLHNGFYYSLTGSWFDSRYTAADGIERSTRYNRNYIFNLIAGKEWYMGADRNKIFGLNARYNHLGGNRIEPINHSLSMQEKKAVYGETDGIIAFDEKFSDNSIFSFTISYRKNKPKYSSVWSFQILNALASSEFAGNHYNLMTGEVDTTYERIMIPNLSYRIEF